MAELALTMFSSEDNLIELPSRENQAGLFQRQRRIVMKKVGKFEVYSMEEVLDEALGPIGTPDRDLHERQVAEAVHDYHILSSKSEDITEINDAII